MRARILGLLLCCILIGWASALSEDGADCSHQWKDVEDAALVASSRIEMKAENDVYHVIYRLKPDAVCTICGQIAYCGSGSYVVHSYVVKEWAREEKGMIRIVYECCVCYHVHEVRVELQVVYDGTAESCLYGGKCDLRNVGFMNDRGQVLSNLNISIPNVFETGDMVWLSALIYDNAEGTFLFAGREYCPVCGRARISTRETPTTGFRDRYNGLPIMTEDYFLTVDMPDNLPYQLIDQLRQEAGAV